MDDFESLYRMWPSPKDEFYLVEGENSYCNQFVRRSKKSICLIDKVEGEIIWFEFDDDFFDFLKTKKGRGEEHLIDLGYEDYIEFLFGIFEVDNRVFRCN